MRFFLVFLFTFFAIPFQAPLFFSPLLVHLFCFFMRMNWFVLLFLLDTWPADLFLVNEIDADVPEMLALVQVNLSFVGEVKKGDKGEDLVLFGCVRS